MVDTASGTLAELALRSHDASWTYTRWTLLPDDSNRYEVIDGVLYMTTAPSAFHQWIVSRIVYQLYAQVEQPQLGLVLWAPIGVLMPGCEPVQPDILVVRQADLAIIRERRVHGVPALIVEVLSPSNATQDTEIKRAAYARAGVAEYWIVRPVERDVLVHTLPDASLGSFLQIDHVGANAELASPTLPFRAPVASFFAGAPDETP